MGEHLIKPYEISVWEEKLISDGAGGYTFSENKLAVIGSDTMTGLNKVYDPVFNKKSNGEKSLTFSLKYRYFDPYSGEEVENPFAAYLVNERKVKLKYGTDDNGQPQWYEFVIKDHTESTEESTWTYTCTDAFVLELSKNGYNLTFDAELNNNQGTASELAEKVLENTDWQLGDSGDVFKQLIAEPIYEATLLQTDNITIINVDTGEEETFLNQELNIYVFYSYVKNQNGKFIQFILRNNEGLYNIDDRNVITATNYRIETELTYDATNRWFVLGSNTIIHLGVIDNLYQANRLAYNQLTTYDPIMGRTVDRFRVVDGEGEEVDSTEIYRYTDYEYTTSNIVMNYFTNGDNFNSLEDGTLQGWNPYTDQEYEYSEVERPGESNPQEKGWYELVNEVYVLTSDTEVQQGKTYYKLGPKTVNKLELITYPELATGKPLADLSTLSQIEGYLKTTFNGTGGTPINGQYYNTIYNSGIENNASFIHSISKGDKFVFRWRAGKGELGQLEPVKTLGMIIARYEQDASTRFGYYYKHIKEEDVLVHFVGQPSSANLSVANNLITGGTIVTENGQEHYIINGTIQTPSTKYVYESENELYVWNGTESGFDVLDDENYSNYLPYYYLIAEAREAVPNTVLSDPNVHIGIFIYTTKIETTTVQDPETERLVTTIDPIYIQDIQLTRFVQDSGHENEEYPILIGNVPTATTQPIEYYYVKPESGMAAEDIETYTTPEQLAVRLGLSSDAIQPKYNENSEKTLSISASQSNCFNILQTIAETFECWIDLVVGHDEQGYITSTEGTLDKFVYLREYVGKDNYAGFKYGINLQSIERDINSDEIVTKLIVDQSQSEYVSEGFISIASAPSNPSGESYILNFDYYYNQGLLNKEEVEADKNKFIVEVAELNNKLKDKETQRINLEASLTALESKRTVFTELINTAEDTLTENLDKFERLTKLTYEEYREKHGELVEEQEQTQRFTAENIRDEDITEDDFTVRIEYTPVRKSTIQVICENLELDVNFTAGTIGTYEGEGEFTLTYDGQISFIFENQEIDDNEIVIKYTIVTSQLTDEDTILEVLGTLYACSSTINNYAGLLTNIEQEYWNVRHQLRGSENYSVKFWEAEDDNLQRHVLVEFSDYLIGAGFKLGQNEYEVTISRKFFDLTTNETSIKIIIPEGYKIDSEIEPAPDTYIISGTQTVTIKSINSYSGVQDEIDDLHTRKDALTNAFNNKYRRFIQEGTWNSTDYIDSELYYLDALQVSNTSSQPQVSYTINVVEISELEGFELYQFDAGDKSYVEDIEFFGWEDKNGILTPVQEEVIVAEVEWHLDEPDQNVITVQNYKTRFEDLFQRINATVQTVQYNEATYAKISTLLDADGKINSDVLLNSLNNISGQQYTLTSDGSILIDGDKILVRNLTNAANLVIINSEGIRVSSDGGQNWATAIDGYGINAGAVYTGELNTQNVIIGSRDNPSFRWDKSGISAYGSTTTVNEQGQEVETYDLQTYVRYDQYGLYGIKDNSTFKAANLQDILDKAHFAVTWDGFFIKNSYADGGRVSITSDNDFQITKIVDNNEQEVIKIGMLEERVNGNLYGMRIKGANNTNAFIADSEGNIEITGIINALGGNFSDIVTVGKNTSQTTDYIIIDGTAASISSSNYNGGPTTSSTRGWIINKDGDAVFNNITARGAIKTAVFEYAEIQAVGGIFVFRPSSTIKSAMVDGTNNADLILTVEKKHLFNVGEWCKVSNYTTNGSEPDAVAALGTAGLSHIYKVISANDNVITLQGAAAMVEGVNAITTINDLVGGALVNMGDNANGNGRVGSNNYGIGVNSSDNTIYLPRRAISLFETIIDDESQGQKVTYNFRGILGTLPAFNYSGQNAQVSQLYHDNLEGTQGIYTDNMYIGDNAHYITFYTDKNDNNNKKLRIAGADIVFTYDDGQGGTTEKTLDDRIEEIEVGTGEDAVVLVIDSSEGNIFRDNQGQTDLTVTIFYGASVITTYAQLTNTFGIGAYLEWEYKDNTNNWVTLLVSDPRIDDNGFTIHVSAENVYNKANFRCKLVV